MGTNKSGMSGIIKLLLSIVLSANVLVLVAQPSVVFTPNIDAGCAPIQVVFTSEVNGCTGDITYDWDLGNGNNSSEPNPAANYNNPGEYIVILTISCNEGTDTYTDTVNAYDKPEAAFAELDVSGCVPQTVQFQDQSDAGSGDITSWQWYFGDGNASVDQNPEHTYNQPGIWEVTLIVENEYGCTDDVSQDDGIRLSAEPEIDFIAAPQQYCIAPVDVSFQNNSSVWGSLGYELNWSFPGGDPNSATDETPTVTYNSSGLYDVGLQVTDDYGCTNEITLSDYIDISQIDPTYEIVGGSPVCKGEPVVFQNTSGVLLCQWDFGDGSPISVSSTPEHIYTSAGEYPVTFTVDPGGPCETSTNFDIVVEGVNADFTMDPADAFSCEIPFHVEFSNTSSTTTGAGFSEYAWNFGDSGDADTEDASHDYLSSGVFYPSLIVTSENGCEGTHVGDPVEIVVPDASFTVDSTSGCLGFVADFTYDGGVPEEEIESLEWDLGDGTEIDDETEFAHEYADTGEYDATLVLTDINGCVGTHEVTIRVGDHQTPMFEIDQNIVCAQEDTVHFTQLSEDSTIIDEWHWDFEDFGDTDDYHPEYTFDEDTGFVHIELVVGFNGCRDTLVDSTSLYVSGPVIESIDPEVDCGDPFNYSFDLEIIDGDNWDVDFGDGTTPIEATTQASVAHTYASEGEYMVIVTAYNETTDCEFIDSVNINVVVPSVDFTLPINQVCAGDITFDASGSENAVAYQWDYGDGQVSDWMDTSIVTHHYNATGDVEVTLTIQDTNDCEVSQTHTLHLIGPEVHFSADPTEGCVPVVVTFTDNSSAEEDVVYYHWDFGDGESASGGGLSSTDHTFDEAGTYSVTLSVTTQSGCPGSLTIENMIVTADVSADFYVNDDERVYCTGEDVVFHPENMSPDYSYEWDFGDGETSNDAEPTHVYEDGGIYNVSLTVTDDITGCTDIILREDFIEIQEAIADFEVNQTDFPCNPAQVQITALFDQYEYVPDWTWTMGDGSDPITEYSPSYSYNQPGNYTIELILVTSHGCSASATEDITVEGPYTEIMIESTDICVGDTIDFSMSSTEDITSVAWDFGDGTGSGNFETSHVYDAEHVGEVTISLIYYSEECDPGTAEQVLQIYDVTSDFNILNADTGQPDTQECSPFTINLQNTSSGQSMNDWYVNDEFLSSDEFLEDLEFVNNTFTDSTIYIQLDVANDLGCSDSKIDSIMVLAAPDLEITADTIICEGDDLQLSATGGGSYEWMPEAGLDDPEIANPIASPVTPVTYKLTVTGNNSCIAEDSVFINVQYRPGVTVTPDSHAIEIGGSVQTFVTIDQENTEYFWSPDYRMSCNNCLEPWFSPLETQQYVLTVSDSLGCFTDEYYVDVEVSREFTLDVPKAFTPEGAPANQVVYVKGKGIKNLVDFRIYNRWGVCVFRTDDIDEGWNGMYKGELQDIDTYTYYVKAEMWDGSVESKKGNILLMR